MAMGFDDTMIQQTIKVRRDSLMSRKLTARMADLFASLRIDLPLGEVAGSLAAIARVDQRFRRRQTILSALLATASCP